MRFQALGISGLASKIPSSMYSVALGSLVTAVMIIMAGCSAANNGFDELLGNSTTILNQSGGNSGGGGVGAFAGISTIDQISPTSLKINWANHSSAASYKIYSVSGGSTTWISTVAAPLTSYTVTLLNPNTAYTYRVHMINNGAVEDSNTNDVTQSTPAVFTGVSTIDTVTSSSVLLHWSASPLASTYVIYKVVAGVPTFLGIANSAATSYSVTGLTYLTSYDFRVNYLDSSGASDGNTHDVNVTTSDDPLPRAVTGFTSSSITEVSSTISWTLGTPNNASSIEVERCSGAACSNYAALAASPYASTTATLNEASLTPGTIYRYRVRSVNINGQSAWLTGEYTTVAAPTFSGISTVDPVSTTSLKINWPSHSAAASYRVYEIVAGTPNLIASPVSSATSYTVSPLAANSSHTYRVRLVDTYGIIDANTNDVTQSTPAAFAGISSIDTVTSTGMTLHWSSHVLAVNYVIYQIVAGSPVFVALANSGATSYNVAGLNPNTAYTYRVNYLDASGAGDGNTTDSSQTTQADPNPRVPTGFTVSALTDTTSTVSWTLGLPDNATSMEVERCAGTGCTNYVALGASPYASGTNSINETGLTTTTVYRYRIRSVNGMGNSAWLTGEYTTQSPAAFGGVSSITNLTGTSARVNWGAGASPYGYLLYQVDTITDAETQVGGGPILAPTTYYDVSGLTASTAYKYRVKLIKTDFTIQTGATDGTFTTLSVLSVGSINPVSGTQNGGTSVTITGTGFATGATVSIGGSTCTVTALNSTSITCTTSYHAAATTNVVVTNPAIDGQSSTLTNGYAYLTDPIDANLSSLASNLTVVPSDNSAYAVLNVVPRDPANARLGTGLTVEVKITASSGAGTPAVTNAAGSTVACTLTAGTCTKATDNGDGSYTVYAKSNGVKNVTYTAYVSNGGPTAALTTTPSIDFDSSQYVVVSGGTTTVDNTATYLGRNLYAVGGTMTFGSLSEGQSYGYLVVNGGTVNHTATDASNTRKLDISVTGLAVYSGSINVTGLGYTSTYSYGSSAPSQNLRSYNSGGASHGGMAGHGYWETTAATVGPVYGNYRNPIYPGAGHGGNGGGVIHITSSGACVVNGAGTLVSGGQNASAGGSIYLRCTSIGGNASAGAITANGGNQNGGQGGGGGGRIALISTGDVYSFWSGFKYPTDSSTATTFKTRVRAWGGNGDFWRGAGGAGTIYTAHSGSTYGDLLLDNNSISETRGHAGSTLMVSATATVSSNHTAGGAVLQVTSSTPSMVAGYIDLFRGMRVRPSLAYTHGTASDPTDDDVIVIGSNSLVALTVDTTAPFPATTQNVNSGATLRSIDIVDHLSLGPGVVFESYGDFYSVGGVWENTNGVLNSALALSNAAIKMNGAATFMYPGYDGNGFALTLNAASGLSAPLTSLASTLTVTAGTHYFYNGVSLPGAVTISGGTLNIYGGNFSTGAGLTLSGTGSLTVNEGSFTAAAVSTSGSSSLQALVGASMASLSVANTSSVTAVPTLAVTGDIIVSSSSNNALIADTVSATNFTLSNGTVKHEDTTGAVVYRLNMTLGGAFTLNSGTINLYGLGYESGNSWSSNPNVPSTSLSNTNSGGGSHGGRGGHHLNDAASVAGPTYDDYRNPTYPGAGYGGQGGGVLIVNATGACTINGSATIQANGTNASAGGSINLRCGSIGGTAGAAALTVNGGNQNGGQSGGGGGRIALVSSGNAATFTGSFAYPTNLAGLANIKSVARAWGGNGDQWRGNGGAGTIYISHSGAPYGELILDNGSTSQTLGGGTTQLVSMSGTVSANYTAGGAAISFAATTPALSAAYANYFSGVRFRPNVAYTGVGGVATDWSDDDIVVAGSTTDTSFTLNTTGSNPTTTQNVAAGSTIRTIDILDKLSLGQGVTLETYGDVYAINGIYENNMNPADITFNDPLNPTLSLYSAAYKLNTAGGLMYPGFNGTFNLSVYSGTFSTAASNFPTGLNLTGGTIFFSEGFTSPMPVSISAGSVTVYGGMSLGSTLSLSSGGGLTVSTGNFSSPSTITLTGASTMTVSAGSLTATNVDLQNTSALVVQAGGGANISNLTTSGTATATLIPSVTASGDITISSSSSSALIADTVSATNFTLSNGNVRHEDTTSSVAYRLVMTLSGAFTLNSGTINLTGYGYDSGYSWSPNIAVPSTILSSTMSGGPAHGGRGGRNWNEPTAITGATYDDYRNPVYPGAGYGGSGGGALIVNAAGACTVNGTATISANGANAGAGGTINLRCGSIGGTAGSAALTANGGNQNGGQGGGGGGRIALVSSGNAATLTGSFAYPTNAASAAGLRNVVRAWGGNGDIWRGNGGAGTVYISHSAAPYGQLLIDNGTVAQTLGGGVTTLVSMQATVGSNYTAGGATLSYTSPTPTVPATYTNYFAGMRFRPNVAYTGAGGVANDWSDDDIVVVGSSTDTALTLNTTAPNPTTTQNVAAGATLRSIDILDNLSLGSGVTIETRGDIYVVGGIYENTNGILNATLDLNSASFKFLTAGNLMYPGYNGTTNLTVSSGTFSSNISNIPGSFTFSGGTAYFNEGWSPGVAITNSGTAIVVYNGFTSTNNVTMSGTGTMELRTGNFSTTGTLALSGASNLTVTAGNTTAGATTLANTSVLSVSGNATLASLTTTGTSAVSILGTTNVAGDIDISSSSSSAFVGSTVNATNFTLANGTVKQDPTTAGTVKRLAINLAAGGDLTLNSGKIDVSGQGYQGSYSFGDPAPNNNIPARSNNSNGGSHGGRGGYHSSGSYTDSGVSFDDFRNPNYPGGTWAGTGGGVVRIITTGDCNINGSAQILANAVNAAAGGSIYLNCGTIGGSAASGAIAANGGSQNGGQGGGGGGRIALISSGNRATFSGSFAYPSDTTTLNNFKAAVRSWGGAGDGTRGNGGPGSIYLAATADADYLYGDLIIDNSGAGTIYSFGGKHDFVSTTSGVSGTTLFSSAGNATATVTNGGSPYSNLTNLFSASGIILYLYPAAASGAALDPLAAGFTIHPITANGTNTFTSSNNFPAIASSYKYRVTHRLDRLDIDATSKVTLNGADLILRGDPTTQQCDFHSGGVGLFDIPAGGTLDGNAMASATCTNAGRTGSMTFSGGYYMP